MIYYPSDVAGFEKVQSQIFSQIDLDARLPDWPFRELAGNADVCQYSEAAEGSFGPVLGALSLAYGDDVVRLVCLDPSPEYFRQNYGHYPAFEIPANEIRDRYYEALAFEPNGDVSGALLNVSNLIAISGSSGKWAVWAERSWGLTILLTQQANGPWVLDEVNFAPVEEALWAYSEDGFDPLNWPHLREKFLHNFRNRGVLRSVENELGA